MFILRQLILLRIIILITLNPSNCQPTRSRFKADAGKTGTVSFRTVKVCRRLAGAFMTNQKNADLGKIKSQGEY